MKKNAFTLIELLVVIAIIAILAAILFPVFAQAKSAAKDTVTLSNIKQAALGNIMYTNDYDDAFTLVAVVTQNETQLTPWQELVYPYEKSHEANLDNKLPRPIADTGGATTGENLFARDSHFGIMPRAVTQFYPDQGWTWGLSVRTAKLTNGLTPSVEGIAGAGDDAKNPEWYNPSSSLTTTAIANPSNTYLVGQASSWDFFTGAAGNPFEYFVWWTDLPSNAWPGNMGWSGPTVLKNPQNPQSTGYLPDGVSPTAATAPITADGIPNGLTIFATTDGSAHVKDVRGDVEKTVKTSSGQYVMNRFWPAGQ